MLRDYAATVDYLYQLLPDAQRDGLPRTKWDLSKTLLLLEGMGNPHLQLQVVHVGGTNGKGTTSHLLASFATASGLRTGLYTSPHYVDYRERIRIDGEMIPQSQVVKLVAEFEELIESIGASFFEFTVALAFKYFADAKVDLAVIEVGLGGRLDSTNVVDPMLSVITNIGLDHTEVLGDTRELIAGEKAGIIKPGRPVVIGVKDSETWPVFAKAAKQCNSPLRAAEDIVSVQVQGNAAEVSVLDVDGTDMIRSYHELGISGPFVAENLRTAIAAWVQLSPKLNLPQWPPAAGVSDVHKLTGYRGRFTTLRQSPLVLADAGHNAEAWTVVGGYLNTLRDTAQRRMLIVCGFVKGKDYLRFFSSFASDATFYVSAPALPRAMSATEVVEAANDAGFAATRYNSIAAAYEAALLEANDDDLVFVGGSSFVVGALFEYLETPHAPSQ